MKPYHIVFCAAVPLEVKSLCKQLHVPLPTAANPVSHGKYNAVNVTVLVSGVGIQRMASRLMQVQPMTHTCWISYGMAGALSPVYKVGDCIIGSRVQYPSHDIVDLHDSLQLECTDDLLLCNDNLVEHPDEKSQLYHENGAALVDMESYAAAVMASNRQEPFYWIRGISDAQNDSLPIALLECLDRNGYPSVWKALQKITFTPLLLPTAIHMAKISHQIQQSLANKALQFLDKIDKFH